MDYIKTELEEKLLEDIRGRLSAYRYFHSLCVAREARRLAEKYGDDPYKAYIAGIGHDVFKELPQEDAEKYFSSRGIKLSPLEKRAPKLWHAVSGAEYLKENYGLDDGIISAVRYHTTGKENMTPLEKILFVADFTSEDRNYDGVEEMRRRSDISLEYAMEEGLRFTIEELSRKCAPIHPDTVAAYNEILLNMKG